MAYRYFLSTHPDYPEPVGLFRQIWEPGASITFERLDTMTGEWREDDSLSRHLVNGSDHHDEVPAEVGEVVAARLRQYRSQRRPG